MTSSIYKLIRGFQKRSSQWFEQMVHLKQKNNVKSAKRHHDKGRWICAISRNQSGGRRIHPNSKSARFFFVAMVSASA